LGLSFVSASQFILRENYFENQTEKENFHRPFSPYLPDFLLFDLSSLVCSPGRIEEYQSIPSPYLQCSLSYFGLPHALGRPSPRLHDLPWKGHFPLS
jgi:hypothetical protein